MHIPLGWILFTHTFLYEHTTKYRLLPFLFDNIYTVFLLLHLVVQQESPSLYCHPASDTMLRNTLPLRGQLWTSAGCANSSRSYVWELGALHHYLLTRTFEVDFYFTCYSKQVVVNQHTLNLTTLTMKVSCSACIMTWWLHVSIEKNKRNVFFIYLGGTK